MSKRDDDSQADMEVGMTTAERRRRRRRGGGLRVPSDNVPRRNSTPPVVAPVPEDPALAMSIAYSFTSDASEPVHVDGDGKTAVPRRRPESSNPPLSTLGSSFEPSAPEAIPTLIDPPAAPVEEASFEMKTREMTAVDLEALGLSDSSTTLQQVRVSSPKLEPPTPTSNLTVTFAQPREQSVVVEPALSRTDTPQDLMPTSEEVAIEAATTDPELPVSPPVVIPENKDMPARRPRLATVALTEEDLEEVMEAARAITNQPTAAPPPRPAPVSSPPPFHPTESVPELDINDLSERADSSSESAEIEIAVDDDNDSKPTPVEAKAATPPPPPEPNIPRRVSVELPQPERNRPPSVPPPVAAATTSSPAQPATPDKTSSPSLQPPPPVPAAAVTHKQPPAPPPKKSGAPPPMVAAPVAARTESTTKPARGKPWFVDLFDEDYLRTLPFLTPQATQAEAEFAVDAMSLSAGAQVLDVGCGYGRHAMELAARGFHVVGLDLSTPLLVRGGEEAHRRGLTINFIRGDMRELDFDGQFDGAYCLFSTFGYFDDETNKKTAQNIARALKPGGKVLIEILNRDYIIQDLPTRVWWEGEGCVVLEEVELNYFSSRIQVNRSVVFDDGRQLEQEISVRAYSLHEVGKLMHAAGFRVLEVSGGYQTRGRFFGNQSRHIIVLAERRDPASP